ncbi:RluA family pseudouridine synthase [Gordonibacter sp. Marseille-P4307]|uniref:RluA family pseudouridine synthase n=1 Tax=Gordonibacter sp. Marseille-P4307 TaxID=2161815 RepID=UPI000F521CA4|nr:RluA family pseudouridine synthase [Gordonibacter sp. Marseille-P4307]
MAASRVYIVASGEEGTRLDVLLADRGLFSSRSAAVRAIEAGSVLVKGRPAAKKLAVKAGDPIVYTVEEVLAQESAPMRGEDIDLDIRFEDDHLIVLSKQVGLVCHPSDDHRDGTLVHALVHHCGDQNLCNVQGDSDRRGIVHRLDMDTSGLMLAAKTDAAGEALMRAIQDRVVDRHYLALVHGIIAHDTGMIDAPIARSAKDRKRMAVRDVPSARDAITTFHVLERFEAARFDDGYTLIDCKLFTGRTHQIRVHMEYTRHPLVGEPAYTSGMPKKGDPNLGLRRQFLHSFKLALDHPATGERLEFADNVPRDLQEALDGLADRSMGRTAAGTEAFELLARSPRPSVEGVPLSES